MSYLEIIRFVSVAFQLAVAIYALWLNQVFGTTRAGWSLFGAFALMALTYATRVWDNDTTVWPTGVIPEAVYLFTSLLLLMGLSHVHAVFNERKLAEKALEAARLQLEHRVRERTADLALANENLLKEMDERKFLQEQLFRSQKMEALGRLAAGVTHYLNNILLVIEGHIQLWFEEHQQAAGTVERVKQIRAAAGDAANLTRQLMSFTRRQAIRREVLNLDDVITNLAPKLRSSLGDRVSLRLERAERPPIIYADRSLMDQILMNLALNARGAMPDGGAFCVSAARHSIEEGYQKHQPDARAGEFIRLTVSDTGCGMSPEVMAHLFEPFYAPSAHGKNTGLGLATVYGIVRQHGGWIEALSEVGKGTTFRVFLPLASQVPE